MAAGKSILALSKVRLSYLIKHIYSSRNLSSAAERLDVPLPVPDVHPSESPNNWRNPSDVHHSINPNENPTYEFGKNPIGHSVNSGGYNVQNPSFGVYHGGGNGNYGVYGQQFGNVQSNLYGSDHWSGQGNREGYEGGYQNRAAGQNANSGELYHQSNAIWQNHGSVGHVDYSSSFEQNINAGLCQMNAINVSSGTQAMNDTKSVEESGEVSEDTGYIGSLEEFDTLCKERKVKEVLEVLLLLEKKGIVVDLPRYVQLMQLCGESKALQEAKTVHEHIRRCMFPINVYTNNRILEMYWQCGSVDDAFAVFDKMSERNLSSWDNMISWLSKNGLGEDALDLFTRFKEAGLKPDAEMFISVFSACAVAMGGDVHEGNFHFESMNKDYGIVPSMEHYVSIVDMLGRVGHLDEALEFIERMPLEPSIEVWETLMNLSRVHGDVELGDRCAQFVEMLDPLRLDGPSKSGLVPANDVAAVGNEEANKKKNLLKARTMVREYRAGDTSYPETERIYAQLRGLRTLMKEAGYVPEIRFVLHDIDPESKEDALLAHSERLAVSYGLLTTPPRAQIRIMKNLRVCVDCHNALKFISKLVGREFIMRDVKRFHHIKDGVCTCRDYW